MYITCIMAITIRHTLQSLSFGEQRPYAVVRRSRIQPALCGIWPTIAPVSAINAVILFLPLSRTSADVLAHQSSPQFTLYTPTHTLYLTNKFPPLLKLCPHVIHCLLQYYTLTSSLSFKSRHKFRESIESFANRLSALLFCLGKYALVLRSSNLKLMQEKDCYTRCDVICFLFVL